MASPSAEISVIVPAFNEEKRIGRTLVGLANSLSRLTTSYEIVVVDDGSTDRTPEIVQRSGFEEVVFRQLPQNRGKGEAVRQGVLAAGGRFVFIVDADLPYSTKFFEDGLRLLRSAQCHAVIGARDLPESTTDPTYPQFRVFAGKVFSNLVNLLLPLDIFDTQCGFKGFDGQLLRAGIAFATQSGYALDIELLLLLRIWGCSLHRLPVQLINHHGSKIRVWRDSFKLMVSLLRIFLDLRLGRYPPVPPDGNLEPVACPGCSNSSAPQYSEVEGSRFCRCPDCRTIFQNPRVATERVGDLYSEAYFETDSVCSGYPDYYETLPEQRLTASWIWDQIERRFGSERRAVLDVGCGSGQFLSLGVDRGLDCWGVDPVPPQEPVEFRFLKGHFPHPDLPERFFDLVLFNDSFEHFTGPHPPLRESARLLRPGGLMVLNTPDPQSWIARLSGRRWISLKREHLVLYPRPVLETLLKDCAFEQVDCLRSRQLVTPGYLGKRMARTLGWIGTIFSWLEPLLPTRLWVPTGGMILFYKKRPALSNKAQGDEQ